MPLALHQLPSLSPFPPPSLQISFVLLCLTSLVVGSYQFRRHGLDKHLKWTLVYIGMCVHVLCGVCALCVMCCVCLLLVQYTWGPNADPHTHSHLSFPPDTPTSYSHLTPTSLPPLTPTSLPPHSHLSHSHSSRCVASNTD